MYSYTELPTLGGGTAEAWGINDKGQVVGWASTTAGQAHAVVWNPASSPTDLGAGDNSCAVGINNLGQIVGTASLANARAFLWDPVSQTAQTLADQLGGAQSWGNAINDQGQVVGYAEDGTTPTPNRLAYLWSPGTKTMQSLGTLGGNESFANGINSQGQIAGSASDNLGETRAFFLAPGGQMQDLGALGGVWSAALAMNNLGQTAGWSPATPGGYLHAFFLSAPGGQMQDLGTLTGNYSLALGINDLGQVVGEFEGAPQNEVTPETAFLWSAATGMQNLNDPNLVLNLPQGVLFPVACARYINRRGQIVGYTITGYTSDNPPIPLKQAFLLTPINALPWLPLLLN